ncbi:hypothetical protein Smp_161390 [Schistosoma mansoni]|uniref:hypothetical protein n=1 Tax=Schistosoma mansoni TaxID=6183 RepID=UPI0001A61C72|nr:hypothetical protein Smp_161390 [Schistosoma mansoni]|eukprot:XP_018649146.1 hypothetical protein Smp_161390 [Schistosoma mansoni]
MENVRLTCVTKTIMTTFLCVFAKPSTVRAFGLTTMITIRWSPLLLSGIELSSTAVPVGRPGNVRYALRVQWATRFCGLHYCHRSWLVHVKWAFKLLGCHEPECNSF